MMRPTMVLIVLLAASLSLTLFVVKYHVQDLEEQLTGLNRSITDDKQAIHVLNAEWSHLNDPDRLKALAKRYLGFDAVQSSQVGTLKELLPEAQQIEPSPISSSSDNRQETVQPLVTPASAERPIR
ncbi:MAG: hypothetical protein O3B76_02030 [Proteobacteria bacterium]|nr:hypothetical protein [Pseudomonadota bacterium]MDA1023038.1 hypothetical protein [Pseudomonadota bacterium]